MENIYLDSSRLSFREFLRYILLTIALAIAFMSMELIGVRLIKAEYLINMLYEGMLVFILLQTISPKLNKRIVDEVSFRTDSIAAIIIPIVVAAFTRILTNVLQIIPTLFGGEVIGIAKGQVDMSSFTPLESIFSGTILAPFFEEFIFRVVFFTAIAYIVGFIDEKFGLKNSNKILNLKSAVCWVLMIICNILFSLAHLPDASNFHLYFIVGIMVTIIYVKYGFYASWLCHGFYNYFNFAFIFTLFGVK